MCIKILKGNNDKEKSDSVGRRSKVLRVFEGFAGYGGTTFGLRQSGGKHEVVGYSEFEKFASVLCDVNFKNKKGNPIRNWRDKLKELKR